MPKHTGVDIAESANLFQLPADNLCFLLPPPFLLHSCRAMGSHVQIVKTTHGKHSIM